MPRPHTPLTVAAVYEATEALISRHGLTTTLAVQHVLRERGYRAGQADVSRLMWLLAEEAGWHVCSNGRFQIYAFEPLQATAPAGPVYESYVGRFWLN